VGHDVDYSALTREPTSEQLREARGSVAGAGWLALAGGGLFAGLLLVVAAIMAVRGLPNVHVPVYGAAGCVVLALVAWPLGRVASRGWHRRTAQLTAFAAANGFEFAAQAPSGLRPPITLGSRRGTLENLTTWSWDGLDFSSGTWNASTGDTTTTTYYLAVSPGVPLPEPLLNGLAQDPGLVRIHVELGCLLLSYPKHVSTDVSVWRHKVTVAGMVVEAVGRLRP
jgi:hypothetical protein